MHAFILWTGISLIYVRTKIAVMFNVKQSQFDVNRKRVCNVVIFPGVAIYMLHNANYNLFVGVN